MENTLCFPYIAIELKYHLETDNKNEKYTIKTIWDSAVYEQKLELSHLLVFYYWVSYKDYIKEDNI